MTDLDRYTVGERPKLYKIRRLIKRGGLEQFEWYARGGSWVPDSIDGFAYTKYGTAVETCEHMKVHNRNPDVIYHCVVPA